MDLLGLLVEIALLREITPPSPSRYAILAIANLAATVANHPAIIEEGALQALFSLSNSSDAMSQV